MLLTITRFSPFMLPLVILSQRPAWSPLVHGVPPTVKVVVVPPLAVPVYHVWNFWIGCELRHWKLPMLAESGPGRYSAASSCHSTATFTHHGIPSSPTSLGNRPPLLSATCPSVWPICRRLFWHSVRMPMALTCMIATARIESLMSELKRHYTLVIVTHNMQQASRISDYTAFLYMGRLIEYRETEKLFINPIKGQPEDYITGRFG